MSAWVRWRQAPLTVRVLSVILVPLNIANVVVQITIGDGLGTVWVGLSFLGLVVFLAAVWRTVAARQ